MSLVTDGLSYSEKISISKIQPCSEEKLIVFLIGPIFPIWYFCTREAEEENRKLGKKNLSRSKISIVKILFYQIIGSNSGTYQHTSGRGTRFLSPRPKSLSEIGIRLCLHRPDPCVLAGKKRKRRSLLSLSRAL